MIENCRYQNTFFRSKATFIVYLIIIIIIIIIIITVIIICELYDTDNHNQAISRVSRVITFNLQCGYIYLLFIYRNVCYLYICYTYAINNYAIYICYMLSICYMLPTH